MGAADAYARVFGTRDGEAKLTGRTPLSVDRDRILYSDGFRRQDDKYHVLFFGKTRRARNYTSHTLKAAHVARVVAARLKLNTDLAEAIVLGSKVGGVPFLHEGKKSVNTWIREHLTALLVSEQAAESAANVARGGKKPDPSSQQRQPFIDDTTEAANDEPHGPTPGWLPAPDHPQLRARVKQAFPWASGSSTAKAYTSGAHSYWMLAVNPFLFAARSASADTAYTAQTMYGIWRHSLPQKDDATGFVHETTLSDGSSYEINESHATYEAAVARYCDDITWIIENIAEATRVDLADRALTAFHRLGKYATSSGRDLPNQFWEAIVQGDPGRFYTYFIDDLVSTSEASLENAPTEKNEAAIRKHVALSPDALRILDTMASFLADQVFNNPAIEYRNSTISAITMTSLNILYSFDNDALIPRIERIGRVEGWIDKEIPDDAKQRLNDEVMRMSACVALLAGMSDRDVFDLIGFERE